MGVNVGTRLDRDLDVALKRSVSASSRPSEERASNCGQPVIYCEDNLLFLRSLARESIKLIVTSPPYNLGKRYEARAPLDVYVETQRRVIAECVRVLHPRGSICWQVGNFVENGEIVPLDSILYPEFRAQGLKLRNRIVWHFGVRGLQCPQRLDPGRYATVNFIATRKREHSTHSLDEQYDLRSRRASWGP